MSNWPRLQMYATTNVQMCGGGRRGHGTPVSYICTNVQSDRQGRSGRHSPAETYICTKPQTDMTTNSQPADSPRAIAIVNPKGGTGKTTTAANLAAALSLTGATVLLIDLDPQASLTKSFFGDTEFVEDETGAEPTRLWPERNVKHVLRKECEPADAIVETEMPNVSILTSHPELEDLENELRSKSFWPRLAQKRFRPLLDQYDYLVIDTPGSTGLYAQMAMIAADCAVLAVQLELLSFYEISTAMKTYSFIQENDNPELMLRLVLTMLDSRTKEATDAPKTLAGKYPDEYVPHPVPRSVLYARAVAARLPMVYLYPDHPAAAAYFGLARHLTGRTRELATAASAGEARA